MQAVQYSSRYALTLFFPPAAAKTFEANADWVARYVAKDVRDLRRSRAPPDLHSDQGRGAADNRLSTPRPLLLLLAPPCQEDDALVYLSHDSAKRGDAGGLPSLVAHSSVPYGIRTMQSGTPEADVEADLRARVQRWADLEREPRTRRAESRARRAGG